MDKLRILSKKDEKALRKALTTQFGACPPLDFAFLSSTKGRIYVACRDVFNLPLDCFRVDSIGLYFGTMEPDGFRPSIEASQIIGPYTKKSVVKIDRSEMTRWMMGESLPNTDRLNGYAMVSCNGLFLGSTKGTNLLLNYFTKTRRVSASF